MGWVVFQNISIIWNFNRKILGFLKLLLLKASFTTNFEIAWLFDRKCTRKVFWHFIEDRIILGCFKTRCIKRVVPMYHHQIGNHPKSAPLSLMTYLMASHFLPKPLAITLHPAVVLIWFFWVLSHNPN